MLGRIDVKKARNMQIVLLAEPLQPSSKVLPRVDVWSLSNFRVHDHIGQHLLQRLWSLVKILAWEDQGRGGGGQGSGSLAGRHEGSAARLAAAGQEVLSGPAP